MLMLPAPVDGSVDVVDAPAAVPMEIMWSWNACAELPIAVAKEDAIRASCPIAIPECIVELPVAKFVVLLLCELLLMIEVRTLLVFILLNVVVVG